MAAPQVDPTPGLPPGFTVDQPSDQLPPGFTLDKPKEPASPKEESALDLLKDTGKGMGEAALAVGTGFASSAAAGLAGMAALPFSGVDKATKVIHDISSEHYQPRSAAGKAVTGAMGSLAEGSLGWLDKLGDKSGDKVFEATKSPLLATAAKVMPDVLQTIGGAAAPASAKYAAALGAKKLSEKALFNAGKDEALLASRRVGYTVTPTEHGGGPVGKTLQSVSGKPATNLDASWKNQEITDRLSRLDIGLQPDVPMTTKNIEVRRDELNQQYAGARNLGRIKMDDKMLNDLVQAGSREAIIAKDFPDAALPKINEEIGKYVVGDFDSNAVVEVMKRLRNDASAGFRSGDPEKMAIASVQRKIAEAFEKRLERAAEETGQMDLLRSFQSARKQLAKLNVIDGALNDTTGHVSARLIAAQRAAGAPLDGELKLIADSADAFPGNFQDVDKKGHYGGYSYFDYLVALGSGGAAAGEMAGGHGMGALGMAAGVAARPAIRAAITSKAGQKLLVKPTTKPLTQKALETAGKVPPAAGAAAAAGAADAGEQQDE